MIKIGKVGKANQKANREIKKMFIKRGICCCEFCGSDYCLTFAHRHKRIWYRSCLELLYEFTQVLLLCQKCHDMIEYDAERTKNVFMALRGSEVI